MEICIWLLFAHMAAVGYPIRYLSISGWSLYYDDVSTLDAAVRQHLPY